MSSRVADLSTQEVDSSRYAILLITTLLPRIFYVCIAFNVGIPEPTF